LNYTRMESTNDHTTGKGEMQ